MSEHITGVQSELLPEGPVPMEIPDASLSVDQVTALPGWFLQHLSPAMKIELDKRVNELTEAAIVTCSLRDPELINRVRDAKRQRVYHEYKPYVYNRLLAKHVLTHAA